MQEGHRRDVREETFLQSVASTLAIMIERKRAEKAVVDSEERYRVLAESSQDSIFVIGLDEKVKYMNSFAAKSLGYPRKEIIGEQLSKFFPPEVYESTKRNRRQVAKTGKTASFENKFIFNDQETWLLTQIVPIVEKDEITATMGISRDITERKLAELKLSESEDRYRKLVNASPVCVVIHSEGKIVFINPETVRLLGGKPENIIGKSVLSFVHPDYREEVKDRIGCMIEGGPVPVLEEKFIDSDGNSVDVEVRALSSLSIRDPELAPVSDIARSRTLSNTA